MPAVQRQRLVPEPPVAEAVTQALFTPAILEDVLRSVIDIAVVTRPVLPLVASCCRAEFGPSDSATIPPRKECVGVLVTGPYVMRFTKAVTGKTWRAAVSPVLSQLRSLRQLEVPVADATPRVLRYMPRALTSLVLRGDPNPSHGGRYFAPCQDPAVFASLFPGPRGGGKSSGLHALSVLHLHGLHSALLPDMATRVLLTCPQLTSLSIELVLCSKRPCAPVELGPPTAVAAPPPKPAPKPKRSLLRSRREKEAIVEQDATALPDAPGYALSLFGAFRAHRCLEKLCVRKLTKALVQCIELGAFYTGGGTALAPGRGAKTFVNCEIQGCPLRELTVDIGNNGHWGNTAFFTSLVGRHSPAVVAGTTRLAPDAPWGLTPAAVGDFARAADVATPPLPTPHELRGVPLPAPALPAIAQRDGGFDPSAESADAPRALQRWLSLMPGVVSLTVEEEVIARDVVRDLAKAPCLRRALEATVRVQSLVYGYQTASFALLPSH